MYNCSRIWKNSIVKKFVACNHLKKKKKTRNVHKVALNLSCMKFVCRNSLGEFLCIFIVFVLKSSQNWEKEEGNEVFNGLVRKISSNWLIVRRICKLWGKVGIGWAGRDVPYFLFVQKKKKKKKSCPKIQKKLTH